MYLDNLCADTCIPNVASERQDVQDLGDRSPSAPVCAKCVLLLLYCDAPRWGDAAAMDAGPRTHVRAAS